MSQLPGVLLAVAFGVATLVLALVVVVSRYRIAGPNEAIVVTGSKGRQVREPATGDLVRDLSGQRVVMGAGVFVVPFVKRAYSVDLSARRISVTIRGAVSAKGIKLNLDAVAIVKIGGTEDAVRAAAQRFLDQQDAVESFTQEVLAGALRSIVGGLTVEQIIRDRAAFATRVAEESEASLTGQGLVLDTFQIQDITDDGSYLRDLGRPEQAIVAQAAAIAEAQARQAAEQARLVAEQQIADSQRVLALRQSEIKAETDAATAQAAAAGPLAQAERDQAVLLEREKVAVRQAALTERELETKVRKPADAERYRVEQVAQGARNAAIAEAEAKRAAAIAAAEAEAARVRLTGEAEKARRAALAEALRLEGEATAAATRATGEAEGEAIRAKGLAEAEAIAKRAEALAANPEAVVLQQIAENYPAIVANAAKAFDGVGSMHVLNGADGVTEMLTSLVGQGLSGLHMVKQMMADTGSLQTPPAAVAGTAAADRS